MTPAAVGRIRDDRVMSPRVLVRVVTAVLLGGLIGSLVALAVAGLGASPRAPLAATRVTRPPATAELGRVGAQEVLRRWDAARAEAWTTGDLAALSRLYTPSSVAGARDVAMLRTWTARGERVTAMATRVLALRVVAAAGDRLVLDVTDRLARLEAGGRALPTDRAGRRRLELRRDVEGAWRVASALRRRSPRRPSERCAGTPRRRRRGRSNPTRAGPPVGR